MDVNLGFSNRQVCHFGRLTLWAERGLIHIEDEADNSYECVNVRTELHRMDAISEMLRNSRRDMAEAGIMTRTEFDRQMRMLEQMVDVSKRAQVQGMPSDPTACRDLKRRLPKSVVVPGRNSAM